jgi:hypothetical protein
MFSRFSHWLPLTLLLVTLSLDPVYAQNRSFKRTFTGQKGQSLNTYGTTESTGEGTFSRSGEYTFTNPEGETRTGTFSGQGTITQTEGGLTRSYKGTIVPSQGSGTYQVERTATYRKAN